MTSPAAVRPRPAAPTPIRRALVANRGEIAVRIVRACRALGIESVVAVSTADRAGVAARLADRAVCIGPGPAGQSYLAIPSVLSAALGTGCDAVHPGYGFLSENPEFAAAEEARAAFGDGRLYLERFIRRARHIEVQVLGDAHGNVIHVGERDCTLQRRHQKVVEESPAPNLPEDVRQDLRRSGVAFAEALRVDSAGTVEFIYDADTRTYAFLEFNARIQVEHPVSEMVSGIDLVAEQMRAAAGEPLRYRQDDVLLTGHAIEVRITAEDPVRNFAPHPGTVSEWETHGPDRDTALDRMITALGELRVEGVATTRDFCRTALNHPDFRAARVTTNWIVERGLPDHLERSA